MKIHCVGDSWTNGFGIDDKKDTWPYILAKNLNCELTVSGIDGADNQSITLECINSLANDPNIDLLIVGWSGITRIIDNTLPFYRQFSLSYVPDESTENRQKWFSTHSLDDILELWEDQISQVENTNKKIIMYSVFGDKPKRQHDSMLSISFLEYLANQQDVKFEYQIPIYEFGFLYKDNIVANDFASKYFDSDWERACVERENLRTTKFFMTCGHPTIAGHKHWAEYLTNVIKEKYEFK